MRHGFFLQGVRLLAGSCLLLHGEGMHRGLQHRAPPQSRQGISSWQVYELREQHHGLAEHSAVLLAALCKVPCICLVLSAALVRKHGQARLCIRPQCSVSLLLAVAKKLTHLSTKSLRTKTSRPSARWL